MSLFSRIKARFFTRRGIARLRKGKIDLAFADLTEAIRQDPNHAYPYVIRASISQLRNDLPASLDDMGEAIRLKPSVGKNYSKRGFYHLTKGDYIEALADFNKGIELDETYDFAHAGLAWILATCPEDCHRDGAQALHHALRASQLGRKNKLAAALITNSLAAAYAEVGNFEEAVRWANEFLKTTSSKEVAERGRLRLSLYEQHKPYRGEKGMSPETFDRFQKAATELLTGSIQFKAP